MKNTQKGRSMVEMLGVLAIIGVLSVGGIAGYTVAMNRYRANQILDMASKVAIVAQTMNRGAGGCVTVGTAPANAPAACSANSGLTWTTTGGVAGFYADATTNGGAVVDPVPVHLDAAPAAGVQTAMTSIAGAAAYAGNNAVIVNIRTN